MDAIRFVPRQPATRVEGFGTAKSALRLDRPPSTRVRERLSTGLVEGEESNPEGRPNVWTALHARRGQLPRLPTFREHALETSERTEEDPGDHQANRGEGEGTATGCGPREETGRQPVCALKSIERARRRPYSSTTSSTSSSTSCCTRWNDTPSSSPASRRPMPLALSFRAA